MKVATWNIGGGFVLNPETKKYDISDLDYFIDSLRKIDADLVCLQEVHYLSDLDNQAAKIADSLGMKYVIFTHANSHIVSGQKLSIAILSKFSLTNCELKLVTNPKLVAEYKGKQVELHDKGFVLADIEVLGKSISVLSSHLFPFRVFGDSFSEEQIMALKNEIFEIVSEKKGPTILGVDLNYSDHEFMCEELLSSGFKQIVPEGATDWHDQEIDKILVSSDFKVVNSRIIKGKADHYLCLAEVEFKD
ncbi:hypothetical protein HOC01_03355 [archaeon]|jgi:endonuclease/exonuclease/phosphatase family metal-dependent hydrolase|nr:hypothetical protein [archaeon]MBT6698552.1 hypothetical protein [archaeon]